MVCDMLKLQGRAFPNTGHARWGAREYQLHPEPRILVFEAAYMHLKDGRFSNPHVGKRRVLVIASRDSLWGMLQQRGLSYLG